MDPSDRWRKVLWFWGMRERMQTVNRLQPVPGLHTLSQLNSASCLSVL